MLGNLMLSDRKYTNGTLPSISPVFNISNLVLPKDEHLHNKTAFRLNPGEIAGLVILSILNIFMFIGNILSMITILRSKYLRTSVYYWFVLNLSIVDLLMAVSVLPIYIVWYCFEKWPFSSEACGLVTTIDIIISDISIFSKILVAFDKFMLITRPLTYNGKMSGKIAIVLITSVWTVCITYGILSVYGEIALDDNYTYDDFTENCVFVMGDIYTIVTFCIVFLIPFIFLTYTGLRLYCVARRHIKNIARCHPSTSEASTSTITRHKRHTLSEIDNTAITGDVGFHSNKILHTSFSMPNVFAWTVGRSQPAIKKQKRFTLCRPLGTVIIVILLFVVMCAPYWIVTIIDVGCSCVSPWIYEDICTVLYNLNSLVNPYIYILTDQKYRASVKQLLQDISNKCKSCTKTNTVHPFVEQC